MNANQLSKLDASFYSGVNEMIEDIAPNICDFDDVLEFGAEFAKLCEKYRAKHNARLPAGSPQEW